MDNKQRLGNVLDGRMKKTSGAASTITTELGTINTNLSLTPDSIPSAIPKGEYMVNLMLAGGTYNTSTDGYHAHNHTFPDNIRGLKSGDRVLIVWCGNEPVVIAIVTTS